MAKCCICGQRAKAKLSDGSRVCSDCWHTAGLTENDPGYGSMSENRSAIGEVGFRHIIDTQRELKLQAEVPSTTFISDYPLGFFGYNDEKGFIVLKYKNPDSDYFFTYDIVPYGDIRRMDIDEKQKMVTSRKGMPFAAGGAFVDGMGLIVGSSPADHESTIWNVQTIILHVSNGDGQRKILIPGKNEIVEKLASIIEEEREDSPERPHPSDEVDEIMRYKALLDSGIITEDEFQFKKRQLLGIG